MAIIVPIPLDILSTIEKDCGFDLDRKTEFEVEYTKEEFPLCIQNLQKFIQDVVKQPISDWESSISIETKTRLSGSKYIPHTNTLSLRCIVNLFEDESFTFSNMNPSVLTIPKSSCLIIPPSLSCTNTITIHSKPIRKLNMVIEKRSHLYYRLTCVIDFFIPKDSKPEPQPQPEPVPESVQEDLISKFLESISANKHLRHKSKKTKTFFKRK